MKLYVPACGDRIVLAKDWTFSLCNERRNWTFIEALGLERPGWENYGSPYRDVTLPKGTTLEIDRVYIRAFNKSASTDQNDFDSITFKIVGKKKQRFWAKLKDCNNIEFLSPEDGSFKERKAAEEELAKSQPQRLDASRIRTLARETAYGRGFIKDVFEPLRSAFDAHAEDSSRLHKEAYDEYKKFVDETNEKYRKTPFGYYRFLHLDSFKPLNTHDASKRLMMLDSPLCKFSKRPDGTNLRRFSWPWVEESPQYWYYDLTKYALQGLYIDVVTNESDTEIISAQLCTVRQPNNVKKKGTK